jgi:DNA-binding IclR family transcriptional regulator
MPSRVGKAFWLHCTGIGKALLAEKDDEALDALVTRTGLPARTPLTHTTAASLKADLIQVRARGYALDDEENEPGIRCVAAVIHDHTGTAIAAVSISTLSLEQSIAQVALMAPAAIEAARKISAALGYMEPTH